MPQEAILEMKGIEIQFPGVKALDKVDFTLNKGEIHALLGENGAGKSTLIKCLTGVHHMDAGKILLDGEEIVPTSPQDAIKMGISTVFQEVNLCQNLSVAENIFVGRQPMKRHQIDWKELNRRAAALMSRFHLDIDVTRPLSYYSTAIQQMVSIARAVDIQAKILILDEPTSSLDENEVQLLFEVMRELKAAWSASRHTLLRAHLKWMHTEKCAGERPAVIMNVFPRMSLISVPDGATAGKPRNFEGFWKRGKANFALWNRALAWSPSWMPPAGQSGPVDGNTARK